jgi:hypothetical protein
MYRFRLSAPQVQLELVANGVGPRLPFLVVGPTTEVAYLEELLQEEFGSLTLNPAELFSFLGSNSWVRDFFHHPELLEGNLQAIPASGNGHGSGNGHSNDSFHSQPLGEKLVQAGMINLEELDALLEAYRPFSETQRFGEFLRLDLQVPPQVLDLLLNTSLVDESGFNEKRLGERLVDLGCITPAQLEAALAEQQQNGGRIGEVLARQGLISEATARFFAEARVNPRGEIDYTPA